MLTAGLALSLALACAPHVSADVLLSVAYAESHWHSLAIHDNVTGAAFQPTHASEAKRIASLLISEGHNPDLGLLQINATNLSHTGLTVATAFDPCASMRAGAQILLEDYQGGSTIAEQQAAILRSFSAYNTGSPVAGLRTYAPLVLASAQKVIPALRLLHLPYTSPANPTSPPAAPCASNGWHYSADEHCPANPGWHFPALGNSSASTAGPTTNATPASKASQ